MTELCWIKEPLVLLNPKFLHRFFPAEHYTTPEKVNSLMRASAYIGILLSMFRQSITWLLLPVAMGIVTAGWLYHEYPEKERPRNQYLQTLANEIVSGNVKKYGRKLHKTRDSKHKSSASSSSGSGFQKNYQANLYEDIDTIMQKTQKERAELTDSIAGGVANAPRFARKMLERDQERLAGNRRRVL